jgi:methylthioribose-1-phosphate isomerase
MPIDTVVWKGGRLRIIDQTLLPETFKVIRLDTVETVWEAIKVLRVRGAPAIGVCAAYGVLVGLRGQGSRTGGQVADRVVEVADYLATSRPTAVNLFWALERMCRVAGTCRELTARTARHRLEQEAVAIHEEDLEMCRAIGRAGAKLIKKGDGVLTHCNAGGLATSGYGTALAPMFVAHEKGKKFMVYADETRPLLQGARLTSWELMQAGIDVTLICDNMAAQVMKEGRINLVIVGADRIAANGDAANKIGTYGVALLAKAHKIPFYVAAPSSTFDLDIRNGDDIPIEERGGDEITCGFGKRTAPKGVKTYSPAFDATPARLIAGIITERGILRPPYGRAIRDKIGRRKGAGK